MKINKDNHELDLKLVRENGYISQERDEAMEKWDALPVEESLKRIKAVNKMLQPWFDKMHRQHMPEFF